MKPFAVYTYKFEKVEKIDLFLGQKDEDHERLLTLEQQQDFLQSIFRDDIANKRKFECFQRREYKEPNSNGKTHFERPYDCQVVWEKAGLIFLKISNKYRTLKSHKNFTVKKIGDEPWCHILIDNRPGKEGIAIEQSNAFSNTNFVGRILEDSLRKRFTPHYVNITISNQYQPETFWSIVKQNPYNVESVKFLFAAPNHPWATDLIGSSRYASIDMNAKPTTIFSAIKKGEHITLNETNTELSNYVEACASEGEDIEVKFIGMRKVLHVKKVKDKYVIKQMPEELFNYLLQNEPELFDEEFPSLAEFLNKFYPSKHV